MERKQYLNNTGEQEKQIRISAKLLVEEFREKGRKVIFRRGNPVMQILLLAIPVRGIDVDRSLGFLFVASPKRGHNPFEGARTRHFSIVFVPVVCV